MKRFHLLCLLGGVSLSPLVPNTGWGDVIIENREVNLAVAYGTVHVESPFPDRDTLPQSSIILSDELALSIEEAYPDPRLDPLSDILGIATNFEFCTLDLSILQGPPASLRPIEAIRNEFRSYRDEIATATGQPTTLAIEWVQHPDPIFNLYGGWVPDPPPDGTVYSATASVDVYEVTGTIFVGVIPEPTTFLIWALLAGLGVGLGWRRKK
jgi:hypothetical protein